MNVCGMRPTLVPSSTSSTQARPKATQALVTPRVAETADEPATNSDTPPSETLADTERLHRVVETLVRQMFAQTRGIPLRYYGWRMGRVVWPRPSTTKTLTDALKLIPDATARGGVAAFSTAAKLLSYPLNSEQLDIVQFSVLPGLKYAAWKCAAEDLPYADALKKCLSPLARYNCMRADICVIERAVNIQVDLTKRIDASVERPPRYLTPAMRAQRREELRATLERAVRLSLAAVPQPKIEVDDRRYDVWLAAYDKSSKTVCEDASLTKPPR